MADLILVGMVMYIMGLFTVIMYITYQRVYGKEAQQARLESRIMEDYRPRHRNDDEPPATVVSSRMMGSKAWHS